MGSQNPSISERTKGTDGTWNMTTDSNDADEQKKTKRNSNAVYVPSEPAV